MIQGYNDGGRNQDAPVAIEREEGQRSEDMEVSLDAPAGQMDEQGAHQHLGDGDRIARRRPARSNERQQGREQTDRAAHDDRGPDVHMRTTDGTGPGERRHPEREEDAQDPLEAHQAGKQSVGLPVDVSLICREEHARSTANRLRRFTLDGFRGH